MFVSLARCTCEQTYLLRVSVSDWMIDTHTHSNEMLWNATQWFASKEGSVSVISTKATNGLCTLLALGTVIPGCWRKWKEGQVIATGKPRLQEHNRESRVTAATYVVLPLGNSSFQVAWQFNLAAKQLPTREGAVGGWQLVYGIATELGCFFHTQSHSKLNNRQLCWKPTPLWQTWQIDANCMYVEYHIWYTDIMIHIYIYIIHIYVHTSSTRTRRGGSCLRVIL